MEDPEIEVIKTEAEETVKEAKKKKKKLKPARSQAEIIRTRNSNIMLIFAVTQATCTILILLKTYGII